MATKPCPRHRRTFLARGAIDGVGTSSAGPSDLKQFAARSRAADGELRGDKGALMSLYRSFDFADPPYLFDVEYMGQGVYAAMTPATGFMCRDQGDVQALWVLDGDDIARIRAALPGWAVT